MTDEDLVEKYVIENWEHYEDGQTDYKALKQAFLAGLKAGRPKWHKVADGDLPNKKLEGKQLLVRVRNYTEDYILAYYMLDKYYSPHGKRFYCDTECDSSINIKNIIAWKEIVLPELKESE